MALCKIVLKIISAFVFINLFSMMMTNAQSGAGPVINAKAEHDIKSKVNGVNYHLYVSLPKYYSANDTTHYPVLYMLDGGAGFPIAHSTRFLLDLSNEIQDVIIVAIEYEWERSLAPWFINRTRDYTPTRDTSFEKNAIARSFGVTSSLVSGGAPAFLDIIKTEIIPFIEKTYKTNRDRGISGHSFGGLFAGYCLLNGTDTFNKFGINSPSFWWNSREMFTVEKRFSEGRTSLPAQVFMSVGSREGQMMNSSMKDFADSLASRKYLNLALTTFVFEGETHVSVVPAMTSRTLKVLYGRRRN
ncbi:alpha/beta hydrolase [Pollutibacter soli]|uniref:alpha/beta hydrolase n=1 Tax=Pollutibacter soli TaxID=3034157 RepID=UPI0030139DA2